MTKIAGCKERIKRKQWQIDNYKKHRGSTEGTFWQDLNAVDEAIRKAEEELNNLNKEWKWLKHIYDQTLIAELTASEIF